MKHAKRMIPIILSLIMTLAMLPTGALAIVGAGSLSIKDTSGNIKTTSSYSAYQIVTWDSSTDSTTGDVVYTNMVINPEYKTAIIGAVSGLSAASTDNDILTAISNLTSNSSQVNTLAYALKAVADTAAIAYSTTDGVFDIMDYGYYLVIETDNDTSDGTVISRPILVCIPDSETGDSDVVVNVKTSTATISKKIVESVGLVDSSTASVGDIVSYQSLSEIPTYSADATDIEYYITDTFSAGLSFDSITSVKIVDAADNEIETLDETTDYTLETSGIGAATFRITLLDSNNIKTWGNAGYKMLVNYTAALNSSANYGDVGNPNSVNLTYSVNPATGDTYTTPDDTVITYTTQLVITKTDTDDQPLPGATFELYLETAVDTWTLIDTQTTGAAGTASFTTMEQGYYRITETVAPTGYNLLADPIEFTVSAENYGTAIPGTSITITQSGNTDALNFLATWFCSNAGISVGSTGMVITLENTEGFTLPGTGGIGTTIFTIGGILIILLGIILYLLYMKKRKA